MNNLVESYREALSVKYQEKIVAKEVFESSVESFLKSDASNQLIIDTMAKEIVASALFLTSQDDCAIAYEGGSDQAYIYEDQPIEDLFTKKYSKGVIELLRHYEEFMGDSAFGYDEAFEFYIRLFDSYLAPLVVGKTHYLDNNYYETRYLRTPLGITIKEKCKKLFRENIDQIMLDALTDEVIDVMVNYTDNFLNYLDKRFSIKIITDDNAPYQQSSIENTRSLLPNLFQNTEYNLWHVYIEGQEHP